MNGDGHTDARVTARELFEHEDVGEEVGTRAAQLFGYADAHQPELGEPGEQVSREPVLPIPLPRVRRDLGVGHLAGERLDLALFRRQLELHRRRRV